MKRSKTGIEGFDKLVRGGFPEGTNILITGTPGTAKTIFCLEYIYNGAIKFKEKGLFVSFEMKRKDILSQASQFGWDLAKLEKQGLIEIMDIPVRQINKDTVKNILNRVKDNKMDRLVIDSLSTLSITAPMYDAIHDLFLRDLITKESVFSPPISGDFILKRFIYHLMEELSEIRTTTLLISEIPEEEGTMSRDTVSEFLADGIIKMSFESMGGEYSRSLIVRKMRQTKNNEDIHPVEISKRGIIIHNIG